jgi:hypothetical protein
MLKEKLRIGSILGLVVVLGVLLTACPEPDTGFEDDDAGGEVENTYADTDMLTAEHAVGDSSCPQKVGVIKMNNGADKPVDEIDSVAASCEHKSIDVYCDLRGVTSCSFGSEKTKDITVEFNCSEAKTASGTVKLECYKGGALKATENVDVVVTVK